jgi:lipoate-protein ligase A
MRGGPATLRLYQWEVPTLSLGYFQRHDDRRSHAASRDAAVLRRSSGGGAILHDRELTYSLTLPAGHPLARDATQLYSAVHRLFVQLFTSHLRAAGESWTLQMLPASPASTTESRRDADAEPFLCFERRSPGDVLLVAATGAAEPSPSEPSFRSPAWKLVGSAQRRRGGAILQHGSVLLERSPAAPELPGWRELTGVPVSFAALANEFPRRFSAELAIEIAPTSLPATTCDAARRIELAKYANWAWTTRR